MVRNVAIVMNGVKGRMGTCQHLERSLLAIREQGGVVLPDGEVILPDPILVGSNEKKLRSLAEEHGTERWSTDLDENLADPEVEIYLATSTPPRKYVSPSSTTTPGRSTVSKSPSSTRDARSRYAAALMA